MPPYTLFRGAPAAARRAALYYLRQDGMWLDHINTVAPELINLRLALAAVKQNGMAIDHVPDRLLEEFSSGFMIVLYAMRQNPAIYQRLEPLTRPTIQYVNHPEIKTLWNARP